MARERKKKFDFKHEDFSVSIGEAVGMAGAKNAQPSDKTEKLEKPPKEKSEPASVCSLEAVQQFTLHRESSGRGGRIVTAVSVKPPLAPAAAEVLAKSMRKGLGCGSHIEGARIILQGDIQERAGGWLTKQGARKVVMGN